MIRKQSIHSFTCEDDSEATKPNFIWRKLEYPEGTYMYANGMLSPKRRKTLAGLGTNDLLAVIL